MGVVLCLDFIELIRSLISFVFSSTFFGSIPAISNTLTCVELGLGSNFIISPPILVFLHIFLLSYRHSAYRPLPVTNLISFMTSSPVYDFILLHHILAYKYHSHKVLPSAATIFHRSLGFHPSFQVVADISAAL